MFNQKRKCLVCGRYLDTLFEKARPNVKTCSNRCRQKRYRDRKRNEQNGVADSESSFQSHEIDEARLKRVRCFVKDCLAGFNPYQIYANKGPRGLHASPNPRVTGIDT